jgi:hypothetical protein
MKHNATEPRTTGREPMHAAYVLLVITFAALYCPNAQAQYTESVIYTFAGGSDGGHPVSGLVFDSAMANLYGVTHYGGKHAAGRAYKLTPPTGGGGGPGQKPYCMTFARLLFSPKSLANSENTLTGG